MMQKTTAIIVLIMLIGFGFLAGSFAGGFFGQLTVPASHKAIVELTKVEALISSDIPKASLIASLAESGSQEITALDIKDIAKKTRWANKKYDCTLWKWTYRGETLVFMRVWGPKDGECLVEFSKITMSPVYVDVSGSTHQFPLADKAFGGFEAYWWLYVKVM